MPSAGRIVQLSPPSRAGSVAERRGTGAIRSFRVQLRSDSLIPRTIGARLGNVRPLRRLGCVPQMEPTMITLRVLSTAAVMALLLPMMAPTASFAQFPKNRGGAGVGVHVGAGGGAPVARFSGGGGGAPVARFSGGGGGAPVARIYGGGAPVARFSGAPVARIYGGGGHHGGHRGGGFVPGLAAGAIIGGVIASPGYGYYDGPAYYSPGYYDDQYYDDGAVAVAPEPVDDDAVAYCTQTYRSYDVRSGTFLGYDGLRHPCP
jgi:hypothetical protein